MSLAGIINEVHTSHKAIAITFDDGPNPIYTPQVLDIFREVSGKATFFMIGKQMNDHPEIVKLVLEELHEIGNHTYSHPKLNSLSTSECLNEMKFTDNIIKEMTGKKPSIFRPPYLDYNNEIALISESFNYHTIGALNMDTKDWELPGVNHILSKTRNHIKNGSILIFHDGFGDRSQTVEAVKILVNELTSQGYRLVTVSELMRISKEANETN